MSPVEEVVSRHVPAVLATLALGAGLVWQGVREGGTSRASAGAQEEAAAPVVATRSAPPSRGLRLLAFDEGRLFPALPTPGPQDWLTHHEEEGQTLEEFCAEPRREVTATRRAIRLQPLDDVGTLGMSLDVLAEHLRAYYGLPVEAAPVARPERLLERVNQGGGRRQVLAPDVLRWLEQEITRNLYCVLAVTTDDLYPEDSWNFVFGLASLRHGTGVFSFARMDPGWPAPPPPPHERSKDHRVRTLRRCLKVVTHEVGHMFGMAHCIERACLMNGSNHADEMDRAPMHLCPCCLNKLHVAAPFDAERRYATLLAFYREHALEDEAAWIERLLARVPPTAPASDVTGGG